MITLPLILILYSGFTHAFETDHLLAVSNIVSNRNKVTHAVKDGLFWGLGHTSTILLIGSIVLFLRLQVNETYFTYLEQCVGLMLIAIGFLRIRKWMTNERTHIHNHSGDSVFWGSYSIGLIHGLAGSGALLILLLTQTQNWESGVIYLALFGFGSVLGMMVAAGFMSFPFSRKVIVTENLQIALIWLSSLLCIGYGLYVFLSGFY